MNIRDDFKSASIMLNRLLQFAEVFRQYNIDDWPHYKKNEDFFEIYSDYQRSQIGPLEELYGRGRDFAISMSYILTAFNYPADYPTITSYINYFENGFLDYVESIKDIPQKAQIRANELNCNLHSIQQMIILFNKQLDLLETIKRTVNSLKSTEIYKIENGVFSQTQQTNSSFDILSVIDRVGMMIERHPQTYIDKDEEGLRDHIINPAIKYLSF